MDHKLSQIIKKSGFQLDENNKVYFNKKNIFGLYSRVYINDEVLKFHDLLFDDFVSQWWVTRHKMQLEKRR